MKLAYFAQHDIVYVKCTIMVPSVEVHAWHQESLQLCDSESWLFIMFLLGVLQDTVGQL
jgi:hypothetical protein